MAELSGRDRGVNVNPAKSMATHRPVGALLAGMLPRTTLEIDVNSMDDVEEVFHDRDLLVNPSGRHCTLSTVQRL